MRGKQSYAASAGRAGRWALGFVLFVMLPSCGGGGGTPTPAPRFVVATHGSADFDLPDDTACPYYLDLSIYLEEGGRGWVALKHEEIGSNLVEVSWQEVAGTIEILGEGFAEGVFVEDPYGADVGWKNLSLRVSDEDADGTAEVGHASVTLLCTEWSMHGDFYDDEAELTLGADADTAFLYVEYADPAAPLFPWSDAFVVRSTQPILVESLSGATLVAGGVPIAVTVSPLHAHGPFADGLLLDPVDPLPFSTAIGIDPAGVTDAEERLVDASASTLQTIADPGPLTQNPGFETTGGWLNLSTSASFDEIEAPEGERFASIGKGTRDMIGYFDVPVGATRLTFEKAVYNYLGCPNEPTVSVQSESVLPREIEQVSPIACAHCEGWGGIIPWHTWTYDLSGAEGERVVVRVNPARYTECAPDLYAEIELDDFRIE
jgi:hypothetical protein